MDVEKLVADYGPLLTTWLVRVAGVIAVLLLALVVSSWARRALRRGFERAELDATLTRFLSNAVRWLILVLAVVACLGVFGIQTTSFAAVLGAMGLAIGLGFQNSLSNLAAGVMLLVLRPFKVGDVVNVSGQTGIVDCIDLLVTTLDTFDNRRIFLPNGAIFGSVIENISYHPIRRVDVTVGVAYDADLDHTREVLTGVMRRIEGQPDQPGKEAAVQLTNLGASSVDWTMRVWVPAAEWGNAGEKLRVLAKQRLDEEGLGIPFPQLEVHPSTKLAEVLESRARVPA